jgi:hypothetical protein
MQIRKGSKIEDSFYVEFPLWNGAARAAAGAALRNGSGYTKMMRLRLHQNDAPPALQHC